MSTSEDSTGSNSAVAQPHQRQNANAGILLSAEDMIHAMRNAELSRRTQSRRRPTRVGLTAKLRLLIHR